jgi:hypothetical protein
MVDWGKAGRAGRTDRYIEKRVPATGGQCSRTDHIVTPVESVARVRHLFGQLSLLTIGLIRLSQHWNLYNLVPVFTRVQQINAAAILFLIAQVLPRHANIGEFILY